MDIEDNSSHQIDQSRTHMTFTPQDFVRKWKRVTAREKQTYQEHFLDLCRLVGHTTPNDYDPTGTRFGFEMGVAKTSGGQGRADVAKLGFFGWEYKGKNADLYNARPTWLELTHERLDAAVFAAYGWEPDLSDEEILEKLLALNLDRANA